MQFQEIQVAAENSSISDTMFFCMLLGYWRIQQVEAANSPITVSIDSPEFEKMEAETQKIRDLVANKRPAVEEMLLKHVIKEHTHCCGPNAEHDHP